MAWTLYRLGRHQEALPLFLQALAAAPARPQLHAAIGWCYLKLGQKTDAHAAFQRALDLKPGDEGVMEGLRRTSG